MVAHLEVGKALGTGASTSPAAATPVPLPGPLPEPRPTRRRPGCYLSQDAVTSLPLHTCSLRGFSSCCLGSRL